MPAQDVPGALPLRSAHGPLCAGARRARGAPLGRHGRDGGAETRSGAARSVGTGVILREPLGAAPSVDIRVLVSQANPSVDRGVRMNRALGADPSVRNTREGEANALGADPSVDTDVDSVAQTRR